MENKIFEEKQAFNFYRSYYETSLLLDKEDKAEFLEAILNYQFTGELIEPNSKYALLAFRGQIHSLHKQVNGYIKGKSTYPYGNPTKGTDKASDKGSHKQVQVEEKVKEEEKVEEVYKGYLFSEIKNFRDFYNSFKFNKQYFHIAYKFWQIWNKENPQHKTLMQAKISNWYDAIRLIVEVDKQKIDRLIAILKYFEKCQAKDLGYSSFWFKNLKSVGALRDTNKNGEYRLDKIADEINDMVNKDSAFERLIGKAIIDFKKY